MRILAWQGRRSEALDQFDVCESCLWKSYMIKPDEETLELREMISKGKYFHVFYSHTKETKNKNWEKHS